MRQNAKQNPELNAKILKRISPDPVLEADDLIDFHFLLKELNSYQILRLIHLVNQIQAANSDPKERESLN